MQNHTSCQGQTLVEEAELSDLTGNMINNRVCCVPTTGWMLVAHITFKIKYSKIKMAQSTIKYLTLICRSVL